jgi:DNA-binding transcriptional LysR family regulator
MLTSGQSPPDSGAAGEALAAGPRSLQKIDFNLLLPLQALLVEANVTRAAERTSVGQPAMSASLARLRKHFGDELLVRSGREFELTPLARSLIDDVGELLERMHAVMSRHNVVDPGEIRRRFLVVTSDYVSIVLLKRFLAVLAVEAPQVRLEVVPPAEGLAVAMRRTQADLLIAPRNLIVGDFDQFGSELLFADDMVFAVDRNNALAGRRVSRSELMRQRFLVYQAALLQAVLPEAGAVRATASTGAGYFTVTMQLLAGTQMVCLLQRKLFDLYGPTMGLREVSVDFELPSLVEAMYWHPRHLGDPEHRWLRERLAQIAATL